MVKDVLDDITDLVPLPVAVQQKVALYLKAGAKAAGFLFPDQPFLSQLEGVPGEVGAISDVFEQFTQNGIPAATQALMEALWELGVLDRSEHGGAAAWVLPVWRVDP